MLRKIFITLCLLAINIVISYCQVKTVHIGEKSTKNDEITLQLAYRIQSNIVHTSKGNDYYDKSINSPKSALIVEKSINNINVKWLYVNNLEGNTTSIYDVNNKFNKISEINHVFNIKDSNLFHETDFPGYSFKLKNKNQNVFSGKPVEMCLSNNDKYLWIPYYRRDFDPKATEPSALALIDVDSNKIIRVFPSAPLPKMVACSNNNKYVAVTNWGDNTVHIIDINSGIPDTFQYSAHFTVDYKLNLNFNDSVDRDSDCGLCLRGTVFTPDSKYLFVGRMGGGGIAVFDMNEQKYIGSVFGTKTNVRHLLIKDYYLYLSSNKDGVVQRTLWKDFLAFALDHKKGALYNNWNTVFTGVGARTISITSDGSYLFATANNESKISIVRTKDMKKIGEVNADSYPVGMTIDKDDKYLVVTAQGKPGGGGNSVMIYDIIKKIL